MAYSSKVVTTSQGTIPIGSNLFGTCSTGSSTQIKDVSLSDFDILVSGVTVHVYFANDNSATNAKLKVGSTDAKDIYCNGVQNGVWESDSVVSFTYYNNRWYQNDAQEGQSVSYREEPNSGGGTTAIIGE